MIKKLFYISKSEKTSLTRPLIRHMGMNQLEPYEEIIIDDKIHYYSAYYNDKYFNAFYQGFFYPFGYQGPALMFLYGLLSGQTLFYYISPLIH